MGVTTACIVAAATVATAFTVVGAVKGIKYLVSIKKDKNKTDLSTKDTGTNCATFHEEFSKDLKANNIKQTDEKNLEQLIEEIKNDKVNRYLMKTTIIKEDGTNCHLEEESTNLKELNTEFNRSYNFSSEIITITDNEQFTDSSLNRLMRIKWENLIELNLSHDKIVVITPLTNYPLINLVKLDLSYNCIEEIDDFQDVQMVSLKKINFSNNKIDSPTALISNKFYELEYIDISNNDFDDKDKEKFIKKYKKNNSDVELII